MRQLSPRETDELVAALREVDVPEPSPLFWDHLSQRVHDAVAAEPAPTAAWTSRLNVAWTGGIVSALAIVVLAITVSVSRQPTNPAPAVSTPPAAGDAAEAGAALPALEDDASWTVMGELASEMDFDQARAAGLTAVPGASDAIANQLSGDEQHAAVELLRQEIKNSKRL
jgi:hypothetical protein